jgi:hypothetical protein
MGERPTDEPMSPNESHLGALPRFAVTGGSLEWPVRTDRGRRQAGGKKGEEERDVGECTYAGVTRGHIFHMQANGPNGTRKSLKHLSSQIEMCDEMSMGANRCQRDEECGYSATTCGPPWSTATPGMRSPAGET